jgi:Zn-dependent peptidase ImmA (M78 family)
MNAAVLGETISSYRNNLGFTLKEVGKWSKLPVSTINDYETGKIQRPDFGKIEQLCKVYGVSLSVLMASIEENPSIHFRLNDFEVDSKDKEEIDKLVEFIDDYENVLELLGAEENVSLQRTYPNDPRLNWFGLGEKIAVSERRYWGYESTQPVDLLPLLQKEGIFVNFLPLPDSIDGFFYMTPVGRTFWITINANKPGTRKNFTLAHEYSHFLLDRDQGKYVCNVFDDKSDPIESRANAVAARLLVPRTALESLVSKKKKFTPTPNDVIELCHIFGVSSYVIGYRLKAEGLISERKRKQLSEYAYNEDPVYRVHLDSMDRKFQISQLDLSFASMDSINSVQQEFLVMVKKAYERRKMTFSRTLSYFRNRGNIVELLGIAPKDADELEYAF